MTDYDAIRAILDRALGKQVEHEQWTTMSDKSGYPGITVNNEGGQYTVFSFRKDGSLSSVRSYS